MLTPTLFCPNCSIYIGPSEDKCCDCDWPRPRDEHLSAPGEFAWRHVFPGPVALRPIAAAGLGIFAWGAQGAQSSGVTALDLYSGAHRWTFETQSPPCGGFLLAGEQIIFTTESATGGRLGGGMLYVLNLRGQKLWQSPLSGVCVSAPVMVQGRAYVACASGKIHCFDTLARQELAVSWSLEIPAGDLWLTVDGSDLYILDKRGSLFRLDARNNRSKENGRLGARPSAQPVIAGRTLYCGLEGGVLVEMNLDNCQISPLEQNLGKVLAAPACDHKYLYLGAHDRKMRAIPRQKDNSHGWQVKFEHSFNQTPCVHEDILYVTVNHGPVAALDASTGQFLPMGENGETWIYNWGGALDDPGATLQTAPVLAGDVLLVGRRTGEVAAFPWHLGYWDWAAKRLAEKKEHHRAAEAYALAAYHARRSGEESQCQDYQDKAISHWKSAQEWKFALAYQEALPMLTAVEKAKAFQQAGKALYDSQRDQARKFFLKASHLYQKAGDREWSEKCRNSARSINYSPELLLEKLTFPQTWEEDQEHDVSFRLTNMGPSDAHSITIRFAGFCKLVLFKLAQPLKENAAVNIEIPLLALFNEDLDVEVSCLDEKDRLVTSQCSFTVRVEPFKGPRIHGDAIILNYEKNSMERFRVDGDCVIRFADPGGQAAIHPDRSRSEIPPKTRLCYICKRNLPEDAIHCDYCGELVRSG